MAELKTKPTDASAADFLAAVPDPGRRADGEAVAVLLGEVTGEAPVMWGPSIVGYGRYRYYGANKKPGDWPIIAFSPRKAELVIYIMPSCKGRPDLLERLGKHRIGGSCLYIKRLDALDTGVLRDLCAWAVATMRERYEMV